MKDLDFDELDRAVNSLLGDTKAPGDQQVASVPVDDAVLSGPVSDTPTVPSVQPAAQPLAARRSTGRFMDVVHPSSDMRTATIPQRPVSRQGVNIAPSSSSSPIVADSLWSEPSVPDADVPETPQPVTSPWPDPIDFNGYTSSEVSQAPVESDQPTVDQSLVDEDKDINQIADAINKTLSQDLESQSPLESPFLTDAKVEKRPLGAFSSEAVVPVASVAVEAEPVLPVEPDTDVLESKEPASAEVAVTEDQPIVIETPLPAELQDDLLLIEADTDTTSQPVPETIVPQQQAPQTEVPVGPTSITQQYTEQPSTGDQPTGAIFDTEAYRKPLSHPAKKKSGWMFVLWIALLLVVGAGAGALVFFYVLPML